jgi:hypothetical protein
LVFDNKPGSTGQTIFIIQNYGNATLPNVLIIADTISGGFERLSPDSIRIGNIHPGQVKSIAVTFRAPSVDTAGTFRIQALLGNNTLWTSQAGLFTATPALRPDNSVTVSVKPGLWSDPATWSTGQVPDATSAVTIRHNITVDIDASCKTLTAESPSQVQVAPGKRLNVLQ